MYSMAGPHETQPGDRRGPLPAPGAGAGGGAEGLGVGEGPEVLFRHLWESSPDAMVVADERGTIVLVNAPAERLFGYARAEMLGRPLETLIAERLRPSHREGFRRYLLRPRVRAMQGGAELVAVRKDRTEFPAEISLSPVATAGGTLIFGCVRDAGERLRAARATDLALLEQRTTAAILRVSLQPIPLAEVFEFTLDLLFSIPWLALECKGAVFECERETGDLVLKAHRGFPPYQVVTCGRLALGVCLCGLAAQRREIVFAAHLDGEHSIRYPGMGPHGHYCLPLVSDGELLGALNLYVSDGHVDRPEQRGFLAGVADALAGTIQRRRAEAALDEAHAELLAAQRIQEHLLPRAAPAVPGFDIAGACFPAESVAGDYFDYLDMGDGVLGLVIADAVGHGFASSLLMATTHARVRTLAETTADIGQIVGRANAAMCRETAAEHYVTLFLGQLRLREPAFCWVNAGHPPGYMLDAEGSVKAVLEAQAAPLGVRDDTEFPTGGPIRLAAGDLILLVTDGVLEAFSEEGERFGGERALGVVRAGRGKPARELIQDLYGAVVAFSARHALADDATIVVVKA
jgi:PAS domain S-box-containing protein